MYFNITGKNIPVQQYMPMICKHCGKKTEKTATVRTIGSYPQTCNTCAKRFDYIIGVYTRCQLDGVKCSFTTHELMELYEYDLEIEREMQFETDKGLARPDNEIPIYCIECENLQSSTNFRWQPSRGAYSRTCRSCVKLKTTIKTI